MAKRVLITGSQGFLGRYVTAALLRETEDIQVLGIGRSERMDGYFTHTLRVRNEQLYKAPLPSDISLALISGRYRYLTVDVLNKKKIEQVIVDFSPTEIIHLASGLKGDSFEKLYNTNIQGTLNLLSACETHLRSVPIIAVSSGGVYGLQSKVKESPFVESDGCNPHDIYQFAKAAEENLVRSFCQHANIPWMVLRVFNIVGPGQDERHVCGRFVGELISIKKGWKSPRLQTGPLSSTRDFVDVRDIAGVIVHLLKKSTYGETYNVCSGKARTIKEVLDESLKLIFDESGQAERIKIIEELTILNSNANHHFGDNLKVIAAGAKFKYDLSSSIRAMISFYNILYSK